MMRGIDDALGGGRGGRFDGLFLMAFKLLRFSFVAYSHQRVTSSLVFVVCIDCNIASGPDFLFIIGFVLLLNKLLENDSGASKIQAG